MGPIRLRILLTVLLLLIAFLGYRVRALERAVSAIQHSVELHGWNQDG